MIFILKHMLLSLAQCTNQGANVFFSPISFPLILFVARLVSRQVPDCFWVRCNQVRLAKPVLLEWGHPTVFGLEKTYLIL